MSNKTILIFILIFSTCLMSFAQTDSNHGLILRGTAYDGTVEMHDDYAIWKAKLRMEFVNEGSKPIILINPFTEYGGWKSKIAFYGRETYKKGKKVQINFIKNVKGTNSITQRLKDLAENLDSEEPPQNYVHIIQPNGSIQFDDSFEIKQNKIIKNESDKKFGYYSWEGEIEESCYYYRFCGFSVSSFPAIQMMYQISLVKHHKNPDLLETLQIKWKNFGVIPIDVNGGLTIITEPIKNIKYEEIDKTIVVDKATQEKLWKPNKILN